MKIILSGLVLLLLIAGGSIVYKRYRVKQITYSGVYKSLFDELKKRNPELLERKYFYINIWDKTCKPCIEEMPELDSIAKTTKKSVGFIFVTDDTDSEVMNVLERKNLRIENFTFLNAMEDFKIGVMKEKKVNVLPVHLVINDKGQILFCETGRMSFSFNEKFSAEQRKRLKELTKPGFAKFIYKLPE